jgi:hypothetical protein
VEIANSVEAVQDGRIYIELINGPMLFEHKATPAEYVPAQAGDRQGLAGIRPVGDVRSSGRRGAVRLIGPINWGVNRRSNLQAE